MEASLSRGTQKMGRKNSAFRELEEFPQMKPSIKPTQHPQGQTMVSGNFSPTVHRTVWSPPKKMDLDLAFHGIRFHQPMFPLKGDFP